MQRTSAACLSEAPQKNLGHQNKGVFHVQLFLISALSLECDVRHFTGARGLDKSHTSTLVPD